MRAAIIGHNMVKFKEHWDKSIRDLLGDVCNDVLKKSNLDGKDIDVAFVANCFSNTDCSLYDEFGIRSYQVRSDIGGALAINQGFDSIVAGKNKIVLVIGAEKLSDFTNQQLSELKLGLINDEEVFNGATLEGLYALIARKYIDDYNISREQLASISVKNHKNGVSNEYAWFRKDISVEDVLLSPFVAEPLRLLDSTSYCDGAAAVLLCSEDVAKSYNKPPFIVGSGLGSDKSKLSDRKNITIMNSTISAFKNASKDANIKIDAISLAEIHDIFSISEAIAIEDLGFCNKGNGKICTSTTYIHITQELHGLCYTLIK